MVKNKSNRQADSMLPKTTIFLVVIIVAALGVLVLFYSQQKQDHFAPTEQAEGTNENSPTDFYYAAIDACRLDDGRIWILYARPPEAFKFHDKLVRFDSKGKPEAEFNLGLAFPHSINPTGNGTYIISNHGGNQLLEIDNEGNIILTIDDRRLGIDGFNINSIVMTPKGNFLASARDWGIAEFDREGKIVWSHKIIQTDKPGFQMMGSHNATLLKNGNVMYVSTTTNEIIEINRKGEKVNTFTHPSIKLPKNARRLENGHLLVSHKNGLTQFDSEGNIVRKNSQFKNCYNFKVEPDGSILLSHTVHGLVFLNSKLEFVRSIRHHAPQSWSVLKNDIPKENLEQLKSLGYVN